MMIWPLILCLATQAAAQETDPNVVVSKMMQRYWDAQTLSGTIVQTTSDGGGTLRVTTKLTYQRPGHILVQQDYKGKNGLLLSLVGNGERFAYDPPLKPFLKPKPRERLFEPAVITPPGTNRTTVLNIGDMYHAAHTSLMPSTLLDLAIAYKEHLKDFRINVRTITLAGVVPLNGVQAYKIYGAWQPYNGAEDVQMRYELYVSTTFDLLKFQLTQPIQVNNRTVNVTTVETADLKVGVPVDLAQFVVK
jgi:outer membrane lipoprotein-sorting protein